MESQRLVMSGKDWALLVTLSVLWGGSFFFVKVAVAQLPPLTLVLCRVSLAALVLWGVILWRRVPLPALRGVWRSLLAMGALNNVVPFSLMFWGQTHIASGLASILNATTPLFTVLLAHLLTGDERLTSRRLAGVGIGLAGAVVIVGPGVVTGLGAHALAELAVLAGAFSYALAGIFGRRFGTLPPLVTAAGQLSASTLLMLPLVAAVDQPWRLTSPGAIVWGAVGGLALLSTALAYVLYFRILRSSGATNLLLVTFLIPVSALLLGTLILGERLAPGQLAGMGLIVLGLAVIDGRWLGFRPGTRPAALPRTP